MNIFILSKDPYEAAKMLCDKHIVKMGLEATQMLCTVYHLHNIEAPYKKVHEKHPCVLWANTSLDNFNWLYNHALAIFKEYTRRYHKVHKSEAILCWCIKNQKLLRKDMKFIGLTEFVQCVPEQYKNADVVKAYQDYYIFEKAKFAKYTNSDVPIFLKHLVHDSESSQ